MDCLKVCEHAAEPTLVDVGHADPGGLSLDCFLCLLLGTDKQDGATVGDCLFDELVGPIKKCQCLSEVNNVGTVALGHDEALHLGIPATSLVSEVDP